jgi:nucleoside triphosphate diphosphatase
MTKTHPLAGPHPTLEQAVAALASIMTALRTPGTGCPWDLEQDFASIAPYTLEEAYEVADAIERGDMGELREELGDLLLQVIYHAQIAEEAGHFTALDSANAITAKMVRRHPHVFADASLDALGGERKLWEDIKAQERAAKGLPEQPRSALDGVALALPALQRAEKLQSRAARVGFDWPDVGGALAKLREEIAEVEQALDSGDCPSLTEELGDLFFALVNVARKAGVDSENALRSANAKFTRRFHAMEARATSQGQRFAALDLGAQDALWNQVKAAENQGERS